MAVIVPKPARRLTIFLTVAMAAVHCSAPAPPTTTTPTGATAGGAAPSADHPSPGRPSSAVDRCIPPDAELLRGPCGTLALGSAAEVSREEGERMMTAAEADYETNRWPQCAEGFGRVARHHPDRDRAAEAAYAAVLCQTNHAEAEGGPIMGRSSGGDQLMPRALDEGEQRFLAATELFICLAPDSEEFVPVAYRRARVYYQANQFHRAALLFRQIALHHTSHELAEFAANLYLDCINVMARDQERREACHAALTEETTRLYRQFQCSGTNPVATELCYQLETIRCAARRRQAEQLAEGGELIEAGDIYMELFHSGRTCGGRTEDLSSARRLFERAGHAERAAEARELLRQRLD